MAVKYREIASGKKSKKIHLFLCKFALNVKKSTPSDGVYAKLGRISLLAIRQIQIVKFANRIKVCFKSFVT